MPSRTMATMFNRPLRITRRLAGPRQCPVQLSVKSWQNGSLRGRELDSRLSAAARAVPQRRGSTPAPREGDDDRQAETAAGHAATRAAPREAFEDLRLLAAREARAVVLDHEDRAVAFAPPSDCGL